ncbi:Methyltransferase-like protein 21D [Podochytrium sp. JEL0797]|nr:Methyltransferase-like protein 21D [Podochytrium sp. JEL0797]
MTNPYSYETNTGIVLTVQQDPDILGTTIWDSCLVLSKYLEKQLAGLAKTGFGGKGTRDASTQGPLRILELGAGCGLLGLVATEVVQDAQLVLTDLPKVLPLLETNTNHSQNIRVETLEWLQSPTDTLPAHITSLMPFDVVLLSDCVYDETAFIPLINTLDTLTKDNPDTLIIMAYERRKFDTEVSFFKKFGELFRFRHVKEEDLDPQFKAVDEIYLFLAKRRADKDDF